jgi:hypothetical protein
MNGRGQSPIQHLESIHLSTLNRLLLRLQTSRTGLYPPRNQRSPTPWRFSRRSIPGDTMNVWGQSPIQHIENIYLSDLDRLLLRLQTSRSGLYPPRNQRSPSP